MKPAVAITVTVIAVLATIVVEETRIKKLQNEIDRLRALPAPDATSPLPTTATPAATPAAGGPAGPDSPATPAGEDAPPPLPGLRNTPSDYPQPDESRIRQLAAGPYARLHLELGLTNREASFLEELLAFHDLEMQKLAAKWIETPTADRPPVETAMNEAAAATMDRVRGFLGDEEDFATFTSYHAMQPERELLGQIAPVLDQQGIALEIDKELKLLEAMHQAREATDGIDWNSPAAIKVIASGDAVARFETEWRERREHLENTLGDFLEPDEAEAFLAAREQAKALLLESLEEAAAAIRGENR